MTAPVSRRFTGLDEDTLAELRGIVGDEYVLVTDGDVEPYSQDATPLFRARPDAVVLPATTEQVAAILRMATARGIPVTPRGRGPTWRRRPSRSWAASCSSSPG